MNKKITPQHIGNLLFDLSIDKDETVSKNAVSQVVTLMKKYGFTQKIDQVIEGYTDSYNQHHQIKKVTVTLKERMNPTQLLSMKVMLKDALNSGSVEITEKVDERILGGIKVETEDGLYIDGTLQGRLTQLRNALVK